MNTDQALEILREEMPEYEFDVNDTGGLGLSVLEVSHPDQFTTHELSLEVLDVVDREGLSEEDAREVLVNWVQQSV